MSSPETARYEPSAGAHQVPPPLAAITASVRHAQEYSTLRGWCDRVMEAALPPQVWACVIDCELVAADGHGVVQPFREAVRLTKSEGATDDATATRGVHLPTPSMARAVGSAHVPSPATSDAREGASDGLHLLAVAFDVLLLNDEVLLAHAVRAALPSPSRRLQTPVPSSRAAKRQQLNRDPSFHRQSLRERRAALERLLGPPAHAGITCIPQAQLSAEEAPTRLLGVCPCAAAARLQRDRGMPPPSWSPCRAHWGSPTSLLAATDPALVHRWLSEAGSVGAEGVMLKALDATDSWRVPRQGHWLKLKRGGHGGPGWSTHGADTEATTGERALPDTVDLVLLGAQRRRASLAPSTSSRGSHGAHLRSLPPSAF